MILVTKDPSGAKKYFAGYFRDNTICWSSHEHVAVEKRLDELKMIAENPRHRIEAYTIRERLPETQTFRI